MKTYDILLPKTNTTRLFMKQLFLLLELARLHRPVGFLLLLWPTLIALLVAGDGRINLELFFIFTLGALIARSAGCVINDIFDRSFDAKVTRTRNRPLASGKLKLPVAIIFAILLGLVGIYLILLLEPLTRLTALIAAICMLIYPLCKRISHWPQIFLGLCFSLGIVMAFIEVQERLSWHALLLVMANISWTVAYDSCYALMDLKDDQYIGVKSSPQALGTKAPTTILLLQYLHLFIFTFLALYLSLSIWFWPGFLLCAIFPLIQKHWIVAESIQPLHIRLQRTFDSNALSGGLLFCSIFLGYILK